MDGAGDVFGKIYEYFLGKFAMVNVRIYRALFQYRQDLVAVVPGT
jgi:hypothetical protein